MTRRQRRALAALLVPRWIRARLRARCVARVRKFTPARAAFREFALARVEFEAARREVSEARDLLRSVLPLLQELMNDRQEQRAEVERLLGSLEAKKP